jgi:FtsP/CotA-like multicopper oxidase with cupredoxin domain
MAKITRRRALAALAPVVGAPVAAKLAGLSLEGGAAAQTEFVPQTEMPEGALCTLGPDGGGHHGSVAHGFRRGTRVDHRRNGFDPTALLRDFDEGTTRRLPNGRTLREWTLVAGEKEIEVAPGVKFTAWTFNGRVPGPTLRCREGDRLRVTLVNGSQHPHTLHFHGVHSPYVDGVANLGAGLVQPGQRTVYEFDAEPFGLHLYHCHVAPLATHIAKGLYGGFLVDPKDDRPPADEMVMVMNGFDTNFDRSNEIYAANTIPFAYCDEPIQVRRGELVRVYLINVLEYDLINSFHIHANFFHYFPTGTSLEPTEYTDTVMQCQGQRGILEMRFPHTGQFMFHAHQSEFTELGWMGFFEVSE